MAFVTCPQIGDALQDWLALATQAQRDALCAALACNADSLAAVAVLDSTTVDFSGDGTTGAPVTGSVVLDPALTNRLTAGPLGLLVSPNAQFTTNPTLVDTDSGKTWVGAGGTLSADASLPVGFTVKVKGLAAVSVTGGATLTSAGGLTSVAADAGGTLTKLDATTFWLEGELV